MKYFEQSFDGELIIINSGTVKNDEELLTCFGKYSQSTKAIIIGHSHQPSIANRELVGNFGEIFTASLICDSQYSGIP